ncbi:PREDICTED: uncharacterized protein LOC109212554 [Nicotiana attenuata]|uniref:uncharacterized protein LOC109212554 n=1 Tax=Nicotiana attenuata TaxID=49451 RepID=UPI000904C779|nr:PREDICTED: uncharacterized protein LOC109212554 [Nicotiana attenuata]
MLIGKITQRINVTYSKQLSYAGRLQVVNAVLFSIYSFCGNDFILPQSVVKGVDRLCREYLWGTKEEMRKVALVAWEKVCCPKNMGGLNIKGCREWNIASVGKLIWQLALNKESLWVRWVHGVYMKTNPDIWTHSPPLDSSWYWRKLNSVKEGMREWFSQGRYILNITGEYSINSSYIALMGRQQKMKVADLIWSAVAQPKHRFIGWLATLGKMLTKDRMIGMSIQVDNVNCILCNVDAMETQEHLFVQCEWTRAV